LFVGVARAAVAAAAFLICSVSFVPDVLGQQPSFNCVTDKGLDKRTICASAALPQLNLDRQLSNLYLAVRDRLTAAKQLLLRQRARPVGQTGLYQARISQLQALLAGPPTDKPRQPQTSTPNVVFIGIGFFRQHRRFASRAA
jgi:uncharacterized protein